MFKYTKPKSTQKRVIIISGYLILFSISSVHAQTTLRDAFNLAKKNSETLALKNESTIQAEERFSQVKGAIFPSLDFNANYQRIDTHRLSNYDADQTNAYLTLKQPLFQGFKEFAALNQFESTVNAQRLFTQAAELKLYSDVSQAFFDLLSARKEIEDLKELVSISDQRTVEVKRRVQVGKSRQGDYLSAQSQLLTSQAQLETAKNLEQKALKQFEFLTRTGSLTLVDDTVLPQSLPPLEDLQKKARNRPDILAERQLVESSEKRVSYMRGSHYPSIDLKGNYYFKREGTLQDSKWDAGLYLTLPLYHGGVIASQVNEALSQQKQEELTLRQLDSSNTRDLEQTYELLKSLLNQLKQYENALSVSEKNYRLQERDYSLGLVNQIDVLQALNGFIENKRAYDRTLYQAKASHHQLKAIVGDLL